MNTATLVLREIMKDSPRKILKGMDMTNTAVEFVVAQDQDIVTVDVAADIGNSRTVILVRESGTEGVKRIIMPSVRSLHGAFSYELFSKRGLSADAWKSLAADEHIINVDGIERFVGRLAVDEAPAASSGRGSDMRYSDGTTLDFILAGVASALPKANTITARIVTVVPISLWQMVAADVEKSLRGTYKYQYNGRDVSLRVESVSVKREAEAAFAAVQGKRDGRTLIIDGGGRTVNLALFKDGEYGKGATLELGIEAALDNVDKQLIGQGLRALTLGERIELLDALLKDEAYSIVAYNHPVRVDTIARMRFDDAATELVRDMRAKVNVDNAQHVYFVGGAAYPHFFGRKVQELLPVTTLAQQPEMINAYGALIGLVGNVKRTKKR